MTQTIAFGTMFEQREILLIPVPFTELSSTKQRPVLVLSGTKHNATHDDIIVSAITSNLERIAPGVEITTQDLECGVLPKASLVRADKIYTLSQSIVRRRFGKLSQPVFLQLFESLDKVLEREPRP